MRGHVHHIFSWYLIHAGFAGIQIVLSDSELGRRPACWKMQVNPFLMILLYCLAPAMKRCSLETSPCKAAGSLRFQA